MPIKETGVSLSRVCLVFSLMISPSIFITPLFVPPEMNHTGPALVLANMLSPFLMALRMSSGSRSKDFAAPVTLTIRLLDRQEGDVSDAGMLCMVILIEGVI